jgi:hypothetical protein
MSRKYRFDCPDCKESVVVDGDVREHLLSEGCLVCSSNVQQNCFDPL